MAPGPLPRSRFTVKDLKRMLKEHGILRLKYSNESGKLAIELRWRDDKDAYLEDGELLLDDHIWLNKGLDNE